MTSEHWTIALRVWGGCMWLPITHSCVSVMRRKEGAPRLLGGDTGDWWGSQNASRLSIVSSFWLLIYPYWQQWPMPSQTLQMVAPEKPSTFIWNLKMLFFLMWPWMGDNVVLLLIWPSPFSNNNGSLLICRIDHAPTSWGLCEPWNFRQGHAPAILTAQSHSLGQQWLGSPASETSRECVSTHHPLWENVSFMGGKIYFWPRTLSLWFSRKSRKY